MNFSVFSINRMWEIGLMIQKQKLSWEDDAPKVDKLITVFIKIQILIGNSTEYRDTQKRNYRSATIYSYVVCVGTKKLGTQTAKSSSEEGMPPETWVLVMTVRARKHHILASWVPHSDQTVRRPGS